MLSYRHGFHAANFADVLKHMTLCLLLRSLNAKDKPYSVIDTHAGAGIYDLASAWAEKNQEFKSGYVKILGNEKLKALVPEYYAAIAKLQQEKGPQAYPGSPYFEQCALRENDHLLLSDLHPTDEQILWENFHKDSRISVQRRDGLESLNAILPPVPRRGLCFIDPAYEEQNDYYEVVKAIRHGLKRWGTGIFCLWYPVLGRLSDHSKNLAQELKRLNLPLLQAEINVKAQEEERGMNGAGLLILNFPYNLDKELGSVLSELAKCLCQSTGSCRLKVLNEKA